MKNNRFDHDRSEVIDDRLMRVSVRRELWKGFESAIVACVVAAGDVGYEPPLRTR